MSFVRVRVFEAGVNQFFKCSIVQITFFTRCDSLITDECVHFRLVFAGIGFLQTPKKIHWLLLNSKLKREKKLMIKVRVIFFVTSFRLRAKVMVANKQTKTEIS